MSNTQTNSQSEHTAPTPPNEASEPGVEQQTPVGGQTPPPSPPEQHDGMMEDTGLDPQEEAEEAEKGHS